MAFTDMMSCYVKTDQPLGPWMRVIGPMLIPVPGAAQFGVVVNAARLARLAKAAKGGARAVRVGQAGEAAVLGAYKIGPKATRVVNGRTRIFDGLTDSAVAEVKNVKYQGLTRQIEDYID